MNPRQGADVAAASRQQRRRRRVTAAASFGSARVAEMRARQHICAECTRGGVGSKGAAARRRDQTVRVLGARLGKNWAGLWAVDWLGQRLIHFVAAHPLPWCRGRGFSPDCWTRAADPLQQHGSTRAAHPLAATRFDSSGSPAAAQRCDSSGSSAAHKRFDSSGSPALHAVYACGRITKHIYPIGAICVLCSRCGSSTSGSCGRVVRAKVAAARSLCARNGLPVLLDGCAGRE